MNPVSVLLNLPKQQCNSLLDGKATVKVMPSFPKSIQVPFTVYLACPGSPSKKKGGKGTRPYRPYSYGNSYGGYSGEGYSPSGTILGEFVCDEITTGAGDDRGVIMYGWHVSQPKRYGHPRALRSFYRPCPNDRKCENCEHYAIQKDEDGKPIGCTYFKWGGAAVKYLPKSWCFVIKKMNSK